MNSYMIDTSALQEQLNVFEQRISAVKSQLNSAKSCRDRIIASRRLKTLKKMRNLLFDPEKAFAFLEKNV